MLKLNLQFFGHLMLKIDSMEKILMLGKTEGKRRSQERLRCSDGIIDSMDMNFEQTQGDSEGQESLVCCSPRSHKESDTA